MIFCFLVLFGISRDVFDLCREICTFSENLHTIQIAFTKSGALPLTAVPDFLFKISGTQEILALRHQEHL